MLKGYKVKGDSTHRRLLWFYEEPPTAARKRQNRKHLRQRPTST